MLGALAVVIGIIGYIPYFRDIFKGKTKPHAFSWLIWGILTAIAFAGQVTSNGGYGAWVTGFTAFCCFIIFLIALQKGSKEFPLVDWISLGGAFAGLILWAVTKNPLTAIILVTIVDTIGFIPTFRKSYTRPNEETLATYTLSAIKYIFGIAALSTFSLVNILYPISLVVTNSLFIFMVLIRRSKLQTKP